MVGKCKNWPIFPYIFLLICNITRSKHQSNYSSFIMTSKVFDGLDSDLMNNINKVVDTFNIKGRLMVWISTK